jgi:hypothetical protein
MRPARPGPYWRAADGENCATTAINPQTLPVDAPTLSLHTGRIADLTLEGDLRKSVNASVLTVAVVRLTGDGWRTGRGLLSCCIDIRKKHREYECEEKASLCVCFHLRDSIREVLHDANKQEFLGYRMASGRDLSILTSELS